MTETNVNRPAAGDCLLEVNNLVKWFPIKSSVFKRTIGNVKAVDGVSFKIRRGQTMGLVGESGCGKSTCGRTILRLQEKTSGQVLLGGQDIFALQVPIVRARFLDILKESADLEPIKEMMASDPEENPVTADSIAFSTALRYADRSGEWLDMPVYAK